MARKDPTEALRSSSDFIRTVLVASEPRPSASSSQSEKNKYAIRFADSAAAELVRDLEPLMDGIQASSKRVAKSAGGPKQLDINFSTPATGLALGVSLKSVHIREGKGGKRYTHNVKRNGEELMIEAAGYHRRQPYAVMVAMLFLPFDSCDDGKSGASSFGSWVRGLRYFSGRHSPDDEDERFEKIYVALYEPDGSDIRFFDVDSAPPKRGRPTTTGELHSGAQSVPRRALSYEELIAAIHQVYLHRNHADFVWADGTPEPLDDDELD